MPDEYFGGLYGTRPGDVWCGNQPSFWYQRPNNNEIGLEMHDNGAINIAYPSSCSCV